MAILNQIAQSRPLLAASELKIAELILDDADGVVGLSSQQLAERAGVSQSSIVKFTQKLGFKGFTAFRLALSEERGRKKAIQFAPAAQQLHNRITQDDTLPTVAQKLMQEKVHALVETTQALDYDVLAQVVDALNGAGRVQIAGLGGSLIVGRDFAYKLLKIGITALLDQDSHVQLSIANTLQAGDVLLVISFSGRRHEVLRAAKIAKARNATLIAITSPGDNPLRAMADLALSTQAEEDQWRSSTISSRTAQNAITDLLFMALVQSRVERSTQIQHTQKLIDELNHRD
ncbi:SIS domain-containing protein [Jeongeupia wiesaeckerbachi]|uniref:MurR/RpiR family transcriptional regulator n=1 Tax=Jeongeupia wiesaeckerbachi TaxID=3051218 RepID=UPI003D801EC2